MSDKDLIEQILSTLNISTELEYTKFGDLERLDLGSQGLSELPNEFAQLVNLEQLNLSNNNFETIPKPILAIKGLSKLNLSQNSLKDIKGVGKLRNLEELDVSGNSLQDLSPEISELSRINSLNLAANQLQSLDKSISKLQELVHLNLAKNLFKHFPSAVLNLTRLTYLIISNNNIEAIPENIDKLKSLWSLDISKNPIRSVPPSLGNLPELSQLNVRNTDIRELPESLHTKVDLYFQFVTTLLNEKMPLETYIRGNEWKVTRNAIIRFWQTRWQQTDFRTSWNTRQMLDSLKGKVISQTIINFLFGSNDIKSGFPDQKHLLTDEQRYLQPLWFIEFPLSLSHGEEFFKFRLNNLIQFDDHYLGYPAENPDNIRSIKRIIIEMETTDFKKYTFDHIFNPNTEEEARAFAANENQTWLTDVLYFPLEEQTKKLDTYSVNFTSKIYLEKAIEEPNVITTNKRFTIPIVRKNNLQRIEQFTHKSPGMLALLIALASVFTNIFSNLTIIEQLAETLGFGQIGILIGVLILIAIFTAIWLFLRTDKDYKGDTVQ